MTLWDILLHTLALSFESSGFSCGNCGFVVYACFYTFYSLTYRCTNTTRTMGSGQLCSQISWNYCKCGVVVYIRLMDINPHIPLSSVCVLSCTCVISPSLPPSFPPSLPPSFPLYLSPSLSLPPSLPPSSHPSPPSLSPPSLHPNHSQFLFIVIFSVFLVTCLRFNRLFADKITYVTNNTTNERDIVFGDLFDEKRLLQ